MRIAVTGAAGHLAAALVSELRAAHDVVPLRRADLDITDTHAVGDLFARLEPGAIINCAAFNDVDGAQRDPRPALEVNAFGVLALARAAARHDAAFVHFGTDFVFDGTATVPHREDDPPRPLSFYGCTKLLGEQFAADAPRHWVLRVESVYGGPTAGVSARDGSLGTIVRKLRAADETTVFSDRVVSPSYAPDVARAVRAILEAPIPPGVYNCVNSGWATWETIAREAAAMLGIEPRLKVVEAASVRLPAPRPLYCALDPSKLARAGVPMRSWQLALRDFLDRTA